MDTEKRDASLQDLRKSHSLDIDKGNLEDGDLRTRFPNVNEAAVIRRIDMRLIPILCAMFLLAFLDRVNISNAAVFGLKTDLNLTGTGFNQALVVFFPSYVLFEIPSNALFKRFKPHVWLAFCMFCFGVVTVLQGLTQNLSGLIATRFFIGFCEAGVFPASLYLIAMWYKREEVQKRYSLFFSSSTLAGGFGGLLASAIGKMDGVGGYGGWRWIFILEGLLTVVGSVVIYFAVPDFPEEVEWLSSEEKAFVKARLYEDVGYSKRDDPITLKSVLQVFKDRNVILGGLMYFGLIVPAYGYAYFAPTIIQGLGFSPIHTQLLSVPPWACTFVLTMIVAAFSDLLRQRFLFVIPMVAISFSGLVILLKVHDNVHLQYGALFLVAMGTFSAMPIVLCWYSANLGGHHRRAVGTAWQVGFGSSGGIISTFSFLAKDGPKYTTGYSICIAFLLVAFLSSATYYASVTWENRRRDKLQAQGAYDHLSPEEKKRMGDLDPDYRYFR